MISRGSDSNTHTCDVGAALCHILSLSNNRGTVFCGARGELFAFLLKSLPSLMSFCSLTQDKPAQPLSQHICRSCMLSIEASTSCLRRGLHDMVSLLLSPVKSYSWIWLFWALSASSRQADDPYYVQWLHGQGVRTCSPQHFPVVWAGFCRSLPAPFMSSQTLHRELHLCQGSVLYSKGRYSKQCSTYILMGSCSAQERATWSGD